MKVTCCCNIRAIRAFLLTLLRKDVTRNVRIFKGIEIICSHMPELSAIGVSSDLRAHQKMLKLTNINYGLSRPMIPKSELYGAFSLAVVLSIAGLQYQPALHPVHT